jgi:hypothetical protein
MDDLDKRLWVLVWPRLLRYAASHAINRLSVSRRKSMTRTLHTATLGALALVLGATFALPLHAQDRSDDQRDQPTQDHKGAPDEHRAPQDDHRDAPRPDEHRGAPDDVATLRHAHPRAAARCHDGFFTNTKDRAHACSKHGGIDIWLAL